MFSAIYFAVASTLSSSDLAEPIALKIHAGRWLEAANAVARLTDTDIEAKPDAGLIALHGDLMLMTGRLEDAESSYRRAQRTLAGSRDALRIASCRNTGWQAFFRDQFSVALNCFKRVTQEAGATQQQRMESLLGITLVLHHLSCTQSSWETLVELGDLASESDDVRWCAMVDTLRCDLFTQYSVRHADSLTDHVYWRSEAIDFLPRELLNSEAMPASRDRCARIPVLAGRMDYLVKLRALAAGKIHLIDNADPHLQWVRQSGLADYRRRVHLEIALAALAASSPNVAESMLAQCEGQGLQYHQHARWYLDYQYCLAKIRQQQGRIQEFSQLYGRYVFAAMRHVRADAAVISLIASEKKTGSDDISSRLPGKYRRAYRYMMDNLDQRDLSVREIASHIGVTERAIQAVFKNTLGLSPSQLIRRQRMERIRRNLVDEDGVVTSVLDVAKKWGVGHRSTLVNSYRQFFNETPSETLAR
jgi:AraC-like DNA-binding protein